MFIFIGLKNEIHSPSGLHLFTLLSVPRGSFLKTISPHSKDNPKIEALDG